MPLRRHRQVENQTDSAHTAQKRYQNYRIVCLIRMYQDTIGLALATGTLPCIA